MEKECNKSPTNYHEFIYPLYEDSIDKFRSVTKPYCRYCFYQKNKIEKMNPSLFLNMSKRFKVNEFSASLIKLDYKNSFKLFQSQLKEMDLRFGTDKELMTLAHSSEDFLHYLNDIRYLFDVMVVLDSESMFTFSCNNMSFKKFHVDNQFLETLEPFCNRVYFVVSI